jgi:asparagine synthase (glutamine-hydrolysing)
MGAFGPAELARLVGGAADAAALLEPEASLYAAVRGRGGDDVRAALAYFQRFYLTDDILVKADRASMMHSLEVRAPFLDTALADFVNRLPSSLKYRFGVRKYLLKLAVSRQSDGRDLLPPAIPRRSKKGFGVPVAQWLRHELRADFAERLVDAWPSSLAFVERREVARLFAEHVSGRANHYKELWALFVLAEWARRWSV